MSTNLRLFGNYELQERLVSGGMAETWRAFDLHFQRTIVIKLLHADLHYNPDFMAHFWSLPVEREAQTLLSLHHPNIARIHGFYISLPGESGNPMPYIVNDPTRKSGGLWFTASPSLSSLSTQWRRQPDAGAALERSRYRRTLPQCAALSLRIKSPCLYWISASIR